MSQKHVLEGLLRPPVEFFPAAVHGTCAFVCCGAPWSLALNPLIGYGLGAAFAGMGLCVFVKAWKLYAITEIYADSSLCFDQSSNSSK